MLAKKEDIKKRGGILSEREVDMEEGGVGGDR